MWLKQNNFQTGRAVPREIVVSARRHGVREFESENNKNYEMTKIAKPAMETSNKLIAKR